MAACACGGAPALPKKIRRDLLDQLIPQTKLKQAEVKALYARFRRVAPNGILLPEQFKQTMGVIGLTDDPFLPDRMFFVFDKDKDGKLNFEEFAVSLAIMIRGTEDEKLNLSFDMAAGPNKGILLEDFQKLIRACETMMSSLVANSRRSLQDEDIRNLFHDMSADEADNEDGALPMITKEAYTRAAQSNDEFLSCLGLDAGHAPRHHARHHSGEGHRFAEVVQSPFNKKTAALSIRNDSMHEPSTSGLDLTTPVLPSFLQQANVASRGRDDPGSSTVSMAQFKELRDRVATLRKVVVESHVNRQHGAAPPQFLESGRCSTSASSTASPRINIDEDDPNERWWTPLAKRQDWDVVNWDIAPDSSMPAGLEDVNAEFERVLRWCSEVDTASRIGGPSRMVVSATGGVSVDPPSSFSLGNRSRTSHTHRQVSPMHSREDIGPGLQKTNVHRTSAKPDYGDSKEGVMTSTGTNQSAGNSRSSNMVKKAQTSRRRKRHRLLGPKKGLAVHFGHENWNMVLSMMIGIRMSVGRSKHEISRELQPVDFVMKEKFSVIPRLANVFDSAVSKRVTMTRFIDYAPLVFQRIRASFGIQHDEYLRSIGPEQLLGNLVLGNLASLSELSSEGKSGAFFYYTADGNYMIKTVCAKEHQLLKRMLKRYYDYITKQPNTLIVRFLGLHCLRVRKKHMGARSTQKLYFVVMGNMFNTPFEINRRYDLKGSWVGRLTPASESCDPSVALKDVDFTKACEAIKIGADRKAKLLAQIESDAKFLCENNVIDYSLLVGMHELDQKEEVDKQTGLARNLIDVPLNSDTIISGASWSTAAIERASPSSPGSAAIEKGSENVPMHQQHSGGMLSTDKRTLYFIGIIDILTPYDTFKRLEHAWKSVRHDWRGVSCCPPGYYAERFSGFIGDAIV